MRRLLALGTLALVILGPSETVSQDTVDYRIPAKQGSPSPRLRETRPPLKPSLNDTESLRREFLDRIRERLSAGGQYRVLGKGEARPGRIEVGGPRAPTPGENDLVNDRVGQFCGEGCVQSEPSIAVSGSQVVIGYNDSEGFSNPAEGVSSVSYSSDGGATWIDGGGLPLHGAGDHLFGDPAVVFCGDAVYYASLYLTPFCMPAPGSQRTVLESEPNDAPGSGDQSSLGDDFEGEIFPNFDEDFTTFFAAAGSRIVATVVLDTLSDSLLFLYNVDGSVLLDFNDDFGGTFASQITFTIPENGLYHLGVASFGSSSSGRYRLEMRVCTDLCEDPTDLTLQEGEPNDTAATADPAGIGDDYAGEVSPETDVDVVSFFAARGTSLQATIVLGTLTDSVLTLFDTDGVTVLAENDDFALTLASQVTVALPRDGTYFVAVQSFQGSLAGTYTLELRSCPGAIPPGVSAISVSRGRFEGDTLRWEKPVTAAYASDIDGADFPDKEYIACDPSTGDLYVSYTNFRAAGFGNGQIELVRSSDGAETWSFPPTIVEPDRAATVLQGSYPAVGPGGEVYVVFEEGFLGTGPGGQPRIQLRRSLDGGATFPVGTEVAAIQETAFSPPRGYNRPTIADFPSIGVDQTDGPNRGNIYVVFADGDRDVRDVKIARSTDGGLSFEPDVRLNDDEPGHDQFFPWVTVDPVDGQVTAVWYDRRLDPVDRLTDVFMTQSNDGGLTFIPNVRVTDLSSSFFVATDAVPNFGDYINATSDGKSVYVTWGDGRNGDPDVFFSRIPKDTDPNLILGSVTVIDSCPDDGDEDGAIDPGEAPVVEVSLLNAGAGGATGISATLETPNKGVSVPDPTQPVADLSAPGSRTTVPFRIQVEPDLDCTTSIVCPPIDTRIYGIDPAGTVESFVFDPGERTSVPTPGDLPSGGPDGLAVSSSTRAFWVNGFGLDLIHEFDPSTGALIPGPFPVASPGTPGGTDGLAAVSPGSLFTLNFGDSALYEIDTTTGARVKGLSLPGIIGGLAGGSGRLFATTFLNTIIEVNPENGVVLNAFSMPDVNRDTSPDGILGLAFDGAHLFAASIDAPPPNVVALDPDTGEVVAISPYEPPSGFLTGLGAAAISPRRLCTPSTTRTEIDFQLDIETDQGTFPASFSIPVGREVPIVLFADDVESGGNGWVATGEWHRTSDRSASGSRSWYFGNERGPGLGDNGHMNDSFGALTSPVIDLRGRTHPELVFNHFLSRELNFDFGRVLISRDGFATSTLLAVPGPALDPAFRELRVDLSEFVGLSQIQVQFTFTSDESITFEGWYVDDIRVEELFLACTFQESRCFPACSPVEWTDPPASPVDQNPTDSRILFRKLGRAAGRQGVRIEGFFDPATTSPEIDPSANGVHFRLEDSIGVLYDLNVPPGPEFPNGAHCGQGDGWRVRSFATRTVWRYRNRSGRLPPNCEPASARGLRRLDITDLSGGQGPFKYLVVTRDDTLPHTPAFPVGLMRLDLSMAVQPAPRTPSTESILGQCALSIFEGSPVSTGPPRPLCQQVRPFAQDRLICKGP